MMRNPTPFARAFGSVRVRITVLAMVVFAIAAVVGSMVLVGSVRGSLEDGVRKENDVALAGLAAQVRGASDATGVGVAREDVLLPAAGAVMFRVSNPNGDVIAGTPAFVTGYDGSVLISTQEVPTSNGKFTIAVASPLDGVRRAVDTVERYLILGIVVLVGLVGAAVWFIVRRALRPVEEMCSEVEEITHGTLHRRVPVPDTHDEIAHLAATMNEMLDRLQGAAARQREFVSDASHELRSPVAAIRTDLEVALSEGDGADWPSVARAVLAEETRLETLLGDLLLLAADDESAVTVAGTTVDLTELAAQEADRTRRVPVALDAPPDAAGTEPPTVAGSRAQLERALTNLVDNAVRHADQQVRISVAEVTDTSPWVQVGVDDDGPGIPVADRERVFDRFTRLDDGRARDEGGAGLGLAVVRSIATRHGGFVWAGASPLGGARFVLSLPRSTGDRPASPQEDPEPEEADLGANGSVAAVTRTGAR